MATAKWPGLAIQGDGRWAVVDNHTRAVMLLTFEANARNLRAAQPYTRQVVKLEIMQRPRVWEDENDREYDKRN